MDTRDHAHTVRAYWECAERRDWAGFAATLSPDVVYRCPQTREVVRGRDAYVRFNAEYPGSWHLVVDRVLVDDAGAMSRTTFTVGTETMTALSLFTMDDQGRVETVEDWWPEPYEAPPGRSHLVEVEG